MNTLRYRLALGLLLVPLFAAASEPAPAVAECPDPRHETPLASETGSVGFMKNLAGHPKSIRQIAGRLLEDALTGPDADAGCHPDCLSEERAEVVYRVSPTAFLAAHEQQDVCLRFEEKTREHPFEFAPRAFDTLDALNDWIMEFSQGRGEDGKLLYERCSSNCSPRYTFLIAEQSSGYEVRTEVQCGLARDKSNEKYQISTSLRRSCAVN